MLLLLTAPALAATWTVAPSGADYSAIQDAIDGASSGDRIEVAAGLYTENLDFGGKDVEVVGLDGSANTLLNASSGSSPVVVFESGEGSGAILEGFTLRNVGGQGLLIENASPTLRDLTLSDHQAEAGASITIDNGAPSIEDCAFTNGSATYGGFIYVTGSASHPVITGSSFDDGEADYGGAIFLAEDSSLSLDDSDFGRNSATSGGVFYLDEDTRLDASSITLDANSTNALGSVLVGDAGSSTQLVDVELSAFGPYSAFYLVDAALSIDQMTGTNTSSTYDPTLVDADGSCDVAISDFDWAEMGMVAEQEAGALALADCRISSIYERVVLTSADTELLRCDISDTRSSSYTVLVSDASLTIEGSTFSNNRGGVLYLDAVDATVVDSTFTGGSDTTGAAIYVSTSATSLGVEGSTFSDNEATSSWGGAVLLGGMDSAVFRDCSFTGNTSVDDGGAIASPNAGTPVTLEDCSFSDNAAGADGGAAYITGDLIVDGGVFSANVAGDEGGALFTDSGDVTIHATRFEGNQALNGGALYADDSALSVDECEFVSNSSASWGGAVEVVSVTGWRMERSLFCDNSAVLGGAIGAITNGALELSGNIFLSNRADSSGGALYLSSTVGALGEVDHNTFVANTTQLESGGAAALSQPVDFTNNIVAESEGDGFHIGGGSASSSSLLAYNAWWSNDAVHVSGGLDESDISSFGNVQVDPGFVDWDGSCTADLRLDGSSALIDAGNGSDPDGSTADIGAYGGDSPYAWDRDGDGFDDRSDCDDTDPDAWPGAPEIDGDGIDQDCDGVDPEAPDTGGDSGGSDDDSGPTDSDSGDTDSGVDSAVDSEPPEDTDPEDTAPETETPPKDDDKGCATAPWRSSPASMLLLLMIVRRSRRSGRRCPIADR